MGTERNVKDVAYGKNKTYSDTSFVTGDSPATHDFLTDTGFPAQKGFISVGGAGGSGAVDVELEVDGANYGDTIRVYSGQSLPVDDLNVTAVRLTWVADTDYIVALWPRDQWS